MAERLQEVASQLNQPAAADPAASGMVTPGGARLAAAGAQAAPGGGRFEFAADVAAMLQVGNTELFAALHSSVRLLPAPIERQKEPALLHT